MSVVTVNNVNNDYSKITIRFISDLAFYLNEGMRKLQMYENNEGVNFLKNHRLLPAS